MFFAGMALGIVAGAAFGIGIMCCVVAGKQEDQRMEQIRIRRQKQGEPKQIQFRDMEGIERFSLILKFGHIHIFQRELIPNLFRVDLTLG